jgi:sporulation protein YlmC with PRC-barrel domain
MRITDDNIHGRPVLTADGLAIGEVTKLYVEGSGFALDGIAIKLRKEIAERLDLKHSTFRKANLEVPAALVQSVADVVLLSARFDELRPLVDMMRDVEQTTPISEERNEVVATT